MELAELDSRIVAALNRARAVAAVRMGLGRFSYPV